MKLVEAGSRLDVQSPMWSDLDNQPETLAELHYRVLRAIEAATGLWVGHWSKIIGPLTRADSTWELTFLSGTAAEHATAKSIAAEVRRYFPHAG